MLRDVSIMPTPPDRSATLLALEAFGRAMLELLECKRCFVLALSRDSGFATAAIRVGFDSVQPSADVITRLMHRPDWQGSGLFAVDSTDTLVAELLGRESDEAGHALAGRLPAGDGSDLVFLAGWRPHSLSAAEIVCVMRAAGVIWATTKGFTQHRNENPSVDSLLQELAFPAFCVDHRLRVLESNDAGRQMLQVKNPVRLDRGALAGPNSLVNDLLRQALRDTMASRSGRGWANTIIPLSTDHRTFAFAWIGAAPAERHLDRLLVVIPQLDPAAGAKRIATAFGLPWAEERIVMRILCGEPPWRIGQRLDLTEATVRTYIKRIMLKLGINRQVEFFLLYILTFSPFAERCRDQLLSDDMPVPRPCMKPERFRHEEA